MTIIINALFLQESVLELIFLQVHSFRIRSVQYPWMKGMVAIF